MPPPTLSATVYPSAGAGAGSRRVPNDSAVSARVKRSAEAFNELQEVINDDRFLDKLDEAKRNPNGRVSIELTEKLIKVLNLTGKSVPWGSQERASEVTKYMAMHRWVAGGRTWGHPALVAARSL